MSNSTESTSKTQVHLSSRLGFQRHNEGSEESESGAKLSLSSKKRRGRSGMRYKRVLHGFGARQGDELGIKRVISKINGGFSPRSYLSSYSLEPLPPYVACFHLSPIYSPHSLMSISSNPSPRPRHPFESPHLKVRIRYHEDTTHSSSFLQVHP